MAVAVGDLPVSVSPERIPERVQHLGARSYRTFPEGIHILNIKVQNGGCATHALRREDAHLGELISHHHRRVAEPELDAHKLPAGEGYAATLLGAQRLCVPLGGACRVPDDDVWCDGVHPFGDRFHSRFGHYGTPSRAAWVGGTLPSHSRPGIGVRCRGEDTYQGLGAKRTFGRFSTCTKGQGL